MTFRNKIKLTLFSLVLGWILGGFIARAGDITPGASFVDGQRLTAAQLAQLVNQAVINPSFYTTKVSQTNLTPTDILLVYSAASGTFHQLSGNAAVFQNNALVANQVPYNASQITTNVFFLGYDSTNFVLFKASLTNMATAFSPFIVPGLLNFSNTLSAYVPAQPAPYYLTNNFQLVGFDTNGILHSFSFSNLVCAANSQIFTNQLPFNFAQIFQPWTVYGTNTFGFTNAWGSQTNFPITNLFMTGTNLPTLLGSDQIPINSGPQRTNTAASVDSLFQYMTNKNAFPPYTFARCQFSGWPAQLVISNTASILNASILMMTNLTTGWKTNLFATNQIYAVTFITNATPLIVGMTTNQVFYVVPPATNSVNGEWLMTFSNYSSAALYLQNGSITNAIAIANSGISGTANTMLYLTNFTGFNADATAVTIPGAPNSTRQGVYDIWFRTPAANAFYYASGNAIADINNSQDTTILNIGFDNVITTNRIRMETRFTDNNLYNDGLIHVLISPQ